MTDMTTLAGQAAHYAEVRARLRGRIEHDRGARPASAEPRRVRDIIHIPPSAAVIETEPKPVVRWKVIVAECASKYGVSVKDILSLRRNKDIVAARYEAMWRLRQETTMSYPQIGAKLGRDHSTVVHAIRKHSASMAARAASDTIEPFVHLAVPVASVMAKIRIVK